MSFSEQIKEEILLASGIKKCCKVAIRYGELFTEASSIKKSERIRRDVRLGKVRFESRYLTIQYFHAEKGYSIRWMCALLGISKAAYYKWLHRSIPQAEQENLLLARPQKILCNRRKLTVWKHCWSTHYNIIYYTIARIFLQRKRTQIFLSSSAEFNNLVPMLFNEEDYSPCSCFLLFICFTECFSAYVNV